MTISKKKRKYLLNYKKYKNNIIKKEIFLLSNILSLLNNSISSYGIYRLNKYIKYIYVSKIKNYNRLLRRFCFITKRSRSVYRLTSLSRLMTRYYASNGYFIGLKKASW